MSPCLQNGDDNDVNNSFLVELLGGGLRYLAKMLIQVETESGS